MDDFTDRSQFRIGDLLVIPGRLIVVRDGQEIKFEPRWMEVLVMLAEHAGETLSTERLLIEVWGSTVYGDSPVSKTISYIRKSISDDSRKPRYVETVSKVGYRLIAPVSLPEDYRRMPSERWTKGSPYVGLSAFGADHASVFCGRSRIVADLLRAMRVQIENQRRFVLIVGASGCGKTSLLRAGAIPLLTKPDGFDGLRAVSVTTCDLAANGSDPLVPLTSALAAWTLGTRPVFPPQTPEQLKALLTETPNMIEGFIGEAFRRHSERDMAEQPYAHLLLTVDHAEALVATTDIDADARDAFARVLQALCACPHVMVMMVTRGDFYLKLIEALPALAELKAGDGHLDVMAPRYGEIGEIIRSPAWKADLSFETDPETRTRLDDALRDAALSQPDALPLLQHTLQILYERRNSQQQLTFAAYNNIGGLEGAIAHRAEEVFTALPANAQASLDAVLAKLIVIQSDNDVVSARSIDATTFDANSQTLINTFIRARLFVGNHHNERPNVGVVHEALLRRWPRAVEWARDNRRFLQAKARLQRAAARWAEEGHNQDHLLNPGRPLAEAIEVAESTASDLGHLEKEYITQSQKHRKRLMRLRRIAIASLTALTIASISMAVVSIRSSYIANQQQKRTTDLTNYIIGELADRIDPTGNLALIESIGTKILAYCQQNDMQEMRTIELLSCSKAARKVGEVRMEQSRLDESEDLFSYAIKISKKAEASAGGDIRVIKELGHAYAWMGKINLRRSKYENAMNAWQSYLSCTDSLLDKDRSNPSFMMEKSFALTNIGSLLQLQGDLDSALTYLHASKKYKEDALKIKLDREWKFEKIVTESIISGIESSRGNLHLANVEYAKLIEQLIELLEEDRNALEWERQLTSLLQFHAMLAIDLGDVKLAQNQIDQAVSRLSKLTENEPENNTWRQLYAKALYTSSDIARYQNDFPMAMSKLEKARTILDSEKIASSSSEALRSFVMFKIGLLRNDSIGDAMTSHAMSSLKRLSVDSNANSSPAVANALLLRAIIMSKRGNKKGFDVDVLDAKAIISNAKQRKDSVASISLHARIALLGASSDPEGKFSSFLLSTGYRHPDYIDALSIFCKTNHNANEARLQACSLVDR